MNALTYSLDRRPTPAQAADLYTSAGLNRPVEDLARIGQMLDHANLLITAWDGETLVGIARSLTDFCYCCYLSDLAVRREYQRQGIGQRLLTMTKETVGDQSLVLLLSVPTAMSYYPAVGMAAVPNAFMLNRVH